MMARASASLVLIGIVVGLAEGSQWWGDHSMDSQRQSQWNVRQHQEQRRRPGQPEAQSYYDIGPYYQRQGPPHGVRLHHYHPPGPPRAMGPPRASRPHYAGESHRVSGPIRISGPPRVGGSSRVGGASKVMGPSRVVGPSRSGAPLRAAAIAGAAAAPAPPPSTSTARTTPSGSSSQGSTGPCGVVEASRIFQGSVAKRGRFPWQVAIYYKFRGSGEARVLCGGALIHPRFVLTAAHCLDPKTIGSYTMSSVLLGTVDLTAKDSGSLELVPDRTTCHQSFRETGSRGERNPADICLLRLPQPAPYTNFIRTVCLPRARYQGDLAAGATEQTWLAAGWGEAGNQIDELKFSSVLQFAELPPVGVAECSRQLNRTVTEDQVCAGGRQDTCRGDSGAPLIRVQPQGTEQKSAYEVIGVLSYGTKQCGLGKPGVFTRVDAFLPWIQEITRS